MENDRKKIEQYVIERALANPEFREKLKSDPRATLEEVLGTKLPDDVNININEEDHFNFHITIPHVSNQLEKKELSEDELSGVSGGWSGTHTTATDLSGSGCTS